MIREKMAHMQQSSTSQENTSAKKDTDKNQVLLIETNNE